MALTQIERFNYFSCICIIYSIVFYQAESEASVVDLCIKLFSEIRSHFPLRPYRASALSDVIPSMCGPPSNAEAMVAKDLGPTCDLLR